MILNDKDIKVLSTTAGMITPYSESMVRTVGDVAHNLSFGQSSAGYDLRLSSRQFKVFRRVPGELVNPKDFNTEHLYDAELKQDEHGHYFILPGLTYGLGVAIEKLKMPRNVLGVCVGKSTYARCGIIANVTPAEPGWEGHLTLEFSNSAPSDCKIYADEGVVQMLFYRSVDDCSTSYADRDGKYQGQCEEIVMPKL